MLRQLSQVPRRCWSVNSATSVWNPLLQKLESIQPARMTSSESGPKECKVIQEKELTRGKWLYLSNHHWTDHTGKERIWEVVGRTTKGPQDQDCVAVVAIVSRSGHPDAMLLIKQFRPPLKSYTIEMPAGLVDNGETIETAALRELKEETGYSGSITGIGRNVSLDPGMSSATMKIVTVKVNGDDAVNKDVSRVCGVQGEHIEVILVPLNSIQKCLMDFAADGLIIDSRVEAFALGFALTSEKII